MIRERLYNILENPRGKDRAARTVKAIITGLILANVSALVAESHFPKGSNARRWFFYFEALSVAVFTMEYLARLWVVPLSPRYPGAIKGRLRWMVTPLAVVDLLAITPFYIPLLAAVDLRSMRMLRLFRLVRILKLGRYSRSFPSLGRVLRERSADLTATFFVMVVLLIVASCLMFYAEHPAQPHKFPHISAAMWWGVCTLTTVGYGDIYPITAVGRIMGAFIAVLGIGLVGLPAGIIASGYVEDLQARHADRAADGEGHQAGGQCPHCAERLD